MRTTGIATVLAASLAIGCEGESATSKGEHDTELAPTPPAVNDQRTDLLLSWNGESGPQVGTKVEDVPEEARAEVRVQDPQIPPERRDPSWIFLADLTAPGQNGNYPVKAVKRSDYEAARQAARRAAQPTEAAPLPGGPALAPNPAQPIPTPDAPAGTVVMYATRTCPVCIKARRWLINEKIPYVEKDVGRDSAAAQSLAAKGKAQGVSTNGVPVFEINGRLLPGFDPTSIKRLLAGGAHAVKSI